MGNLSVAEVIDSAYVSVYHRWLTVLCRQFHAWDIPVWQRKCTQALSALYPGAKHSLPDTPTQLLLHRLQKVLPTLVGALAGSAAKVGSSLTCDLGIDSCWGRADKGQALAVSY